MNEDSIMLEINVRIVYFLLIKKLGWVRVYFKIKINFLNLCFENNRYLIEKAKNYIKSKYI